MSTLMENQNFVHAHALADALVDAGIFIPNYHYVEDFANLLNEIDQLYQGDLAEACEAVRSKQLIFEPILFDDGTIDWWRIRKN